MDNKIKTLRDYLQLSQAAFAKPLDLSPTHIARFEQGIAKPSQVNQSLIVFVKSLVLIRGILLHLSLLNCPGHQALKEYQIHPVLKGCLVLKGCPGHPEHQVLKRRSQSSRQ